MGQTASRDAVPNRAAVVEQDTQRVPNLQPQQAQARRCETFASNRHRLRTVADQQTTPHQAGEGTGEMCPPDGVESDVYAGTALARSGKTAHCRDEIARAIVNSCSAVSLHCRQVSGRAGADRLQGKITSKIEQPVPTVPDAPMTKIVASGGKRR